MWQKLCVIWLLAVSAAIRVPVGDKEESTTETVKLNYSSPTQDAPIYYESDETDVDSDLVPPIPQKPAEDKQDIIPTYLLPPTQGKQEDFYYVPADTDAQSDWYPISQSVPQHPSILLTQTQHQEAVPIFLAEQNRTPQINFDNPRAGKAHQFEQNIALPVPSRQLEPPLETAQNHFILPTPSGELELPYEEQRQQFVAPTEEVYELPILEVNQNFNPKLVKNTPANFRLENAEPTLALHLTPPKPLISSYKKPTKLHPKKYPGSFKPVPIPIAQFAEDTSGEVPKARPLKPFNPASGDESEFTIPDDKETYFYEKTKQKRKHRKEKAAQQQQLPPDEEQHREKPIEEQETSETHFRYPGRNVYPAPLRQAPPTPPPRPHSGAAPAQSSHSAAAAAQPPPPGDRTEFRMHGMKGPHSYQFGYDTGKGKNRQFRFEERDNDGHVRGHYGYVDKHGKLRVVNYDAHPQHGFRADAPTETEP